MITYETGTSSNVNERGLRKPSVNMKEPSMDISKGSNELAPAMEWTTLYNGINILSADGLAVLLPGYASWPSHESTTY